MDPDFLAPDGPPCHGCGHTWGAHQHPLGNGPCHLRVTGGGPCLCGHYRPTPIRVKLAAALTRLARFLPVRVRITDRGDD